MEKVLQPLNFAPRPLGIAGKGNLKLDATVESLRTRTKFEAVWRRERSVSPQPKS